MYEIQLSLSNDGDARKSVVQQAEEEEEEEEEEGAMKAMLLRAMVVYATLAVVPDIIDEGESDEIALGS